MHWNLLQLQFCLCLETFTSVSENHQTSLCYRVIETFVCFKALHKLSFFSFTSCYKLKVIALQKCFFGGNESNCLNCVFFFVTEGTR